MLELQSAENLATIRLSDGCVIYYYNHFPEAITSFESALKLSLWRNYFKPFACVIVHPKSKETILIRDHLGIAPLYYCCHHGKKLIFGDTIPSVLKCLPSTPPFLENQINMLFSEVKHYSDETFYQSIYRVEPGHLMHFKSDGSVVKRPFWQLEPHGTQLYYDNDQDYLEHFSMLMSEAIHNATEDQSNIAAEFSAGLDSSAVYCAARGINVAPKLYMHIANPGTKSADVYNALYEKAFIDHYQLTDIQRIDAEDFNPIQVFKDSAAWFAGPAPYLFSMFAHNIHRAVSAENHPILLSGFGGDQCVSGQIPLNFYMPELIHQGSYQQAWQELSPKKHISRFLHYAKYTHPSLYDLAMKMHVLKQQIENSFRPKSAHQSCLVHPYLKSYHRTIRGAECSLLQGPNSHEVRMRIEYSSIVSKKMGFEYRYPLLYPKLLEFMLSLPLAQKRRNGRGRYLIRQYLSQFLPNDIFSAYRKEEGLGIVPSTFDMFQQNYEQGYYRDEFKAMPYSHLIYHKHQPIELRNHIKGFMLQQVMVPENITK